MVQRTTCVSDWDCWYPVCPSYFKRFPKNVSWQREKRFIAKVVIAGAFEFLEIFDISDGDTVSVGNTISLLLPLTFFAGRKEETSATRPHLRLHP